MNHITNCDLFGHCWGTPNLRTQMASCLICDKEVSTQYLLLRTHSPSPSTTLLIHPRTDPMPRTRNGLSFTQKLRLVKVLAAIAAKGEPISRRDLVLRLTAEEPAAAQYLKTRSNLDRLLEVTEFPPTLIAASARSRRERKGPKIRDLVEALEARMAHIEQSLGIVTQRKDQA